MHYILYKTINLINGKEYTGIHQTDELNDGYLGSGKLLLQAIKKHGRQNFKRVILEQFDTVEQMVQKEIEIVTEEYCKREDTYNIMPGGKWGSQKRNGLTFKGKTHTEETKKRISIASSGKTHNKETRKKLSENNFARRDPERQRKHAVEIASKPKSLEHRENLRKASLKNNSGKANLGKVRTKVKCPHCGKEGANNTMTRWHFDNCTIGSKSIGSDT
jgi:hypothetical protein